VDEARAVLERLDRIDALVVSGAPAAALLSELRSLVGEAEAWARREGPDAAAALGAVERCRAALEPEVTATLDR
jgi:hypothetical protein